MIYLLQSHDKLKIGYTSDINKRMRQYKTHNVDISLISSKEGTFEDEKILHKLCSKYKITSEWFQYNKFIIDAFENYLGNTGSINNGLEEDSSSDFVQIYYEMLRTFYSIKYVSDLKLIIELASMANYNTGEIDLSTKKREVLCDRLGIKKTHLSTSLKRLKELNLIRGEKGSYIIEEAVFWKGDKETRKELMKEKDFEFVIQFKL